MAQTWSSNGLPYCLFLNLNDCIQKVFRPNIRVLASILIYIFNFLPEGRTQGVIYWVNGPRCRVLHLPKGQRKGWLLGWEVEQNSGNPQGQKACPVIPFFPFNWQKLALSWPKHGPHMVSMGSSWILMIAYREASCQIWESQHQYWQKFPFLFQREGHKEWLCGWTDQDVEGSSVANIFIIL